jgi:ADP-ribose pyrophosphatase YjhB (NUDIX family)
MNYGLPGGHLEAGEQPDEAMKRELKEEIGLIETIALQRFDFFLHQSEDKVVLGYVGILDPAVVDTTFDSGEGKPVWLEVEAIEKGRAHLGSYHDFVLASRRVLAL